MNTEIDGAAPAVRPRRRPLLRPPVAKLAFWGISAAWFVLVIVPLIILFVFSFFTTEYFQTVYTPSLDTWTGLFSSGRFEVTLRTLRVALTVTLIELAVGFPFALWLAKGCRSSLGRAIVLALLTIPFFLDLSSRTIVWRAILGQGGLINTILLSTGLTDQPVDWLLYSEFSVHFGMIPALFPPMVLPIYMAITLIDDNLLEASNDLGATPAQTLWRVIVPLSLPGVVAGFVFTLGPALAAWVEPGMLGGGFVNLLSSSIESAYTALRYPVVAALSAFVIGLLLVLLGLLMLILRRFGGAGLTLR
ncbi:ABC transporter permease [Pseudodonghicola flavimaris]|uniref:ABC transporter permease n=1 Tax=Pseudodonghicola flavimaris TaxID=3050036 RepID=A0ABT7F5I6_9RHOB|nr:ABC transporter permease [Pseudodonghicola flavimaris]MDK3019868.1 ABC transporter permease [Pseudodonghicola flavimaris]